MPVLRFGAFVTQTQVMGSVCVFGSGGEHGNPLQYLENPMDRGAWWATVQEVTKSWIQWSMHTYQNLMEVGDVKIDTLPREKRS